MRNNLEKKFVMLLSVVIPSLLSFTFGKGCNACYINPNDFTDTDTFFGTIYGVTINGHFQIIEQDEVCKLTRDTLIYSGSLNAIKVNLFRAIVCGSNGKILRSPGTMNYTVWNNINSGTMEDLNDIDDDFFTAYIVGNRGTILKSTNDGETFFQLNSGTTLDLNEVQCISRDSIRIAGDSLLSLFTTNGGLTWTRQYVYMSGDVSTGFRVDLQTLHFINLNTGWTAGQYYIFKTTNRGLNWITRFKQTQQYDNYSNSIYFHNKDSGIVVGNRGDIQFTTNGGNNWFYSTELQNITTKNLNKFIYDPETGYAAAVGDSGVIIHADSVLLQSHILTLTAIIEGFYNSGANTMIEDTARVYLRNSTSPYAIVDSSGKALDSSGTGTFSFSNADNGTSYYLVIKHRNSIETWSASGNSFVNSSLTFNFSTSASQAYGNNMKQVDASPLRYAIYSGNVNQDEVIDGSDTQLIDNDSYNFVTGYVNTDVNGDNIVDGSDAVITDNNAFNFVSVVTQ